MSSLLTFHVCLIFIILNLLPNLSLSQRINSFPQEKQASVPLFIFGDSYFDAGNNDYINTTVPFQANYPPYGETYFKYPTGRFSDGRLIPDFIAEYAKLPLILPYLYPGYHNNDIDEYIYYGVNFASGGAGALVETNPGKAINLETQANYFTKVSKQVRKKLGYVEAKELLSRAVYIFSIGTNDYDTSFLISNSTSAEVLPYPQQELVHFVIGNITTTIKKIYKEGGRKFGFINVPPVNCLPLLRRLLNSTTMSSCLEGEASILASLHNKVFPKTLEKLQKQLKGFRYSITDFHDALVELIEHHSHYGFKEGSTGCCGNGAFRGDGSCGKKSEEYELCNNANEYVFFDSVHPTEKATEILAKLMWNGGNRNNVINSYNVKQFFHHSNI